MEEKRRDSTIDLYKGIGIVLVMMGHIGFGNTSSYIAHSFHMPMFFLISGFLYRRSEGNSFYTWIKRKVTGLLVPYLIFGVINYVFYLFIQWQKGADISVQPIVHWLFVNTTGLASGSLWFLTALFISNILFFLVENYIKHLFGKLVIVVLIANLGIVFAEFLPYRLPYAMDAGMVGVGLCYAGYLLRKYANRKGIYHILHLPLWELLSGSLLIAYLSLQHGEINMRIGNYNNVLLFWINAIAGSVLVYNLAEWIEKLGACGRLMKMIVDLGERIGKNSLLYVCMNDLIIIEVGIMIGLFVDQKTKLITIATHSLTLVLVILIIELIIRYTPIVRWMQYLRSVK